MSVRNRSVAVRCAAMLCLLSAVFVAPAAWSQGAPSQLDWRATTVAAGTDHTCALTTGGSVLCWGSNAFGQLGNSSTTDSAAPVTATNLAGGVLAIVAGNSYNCALMTSGGVQCWGANGNGQLGNGTTANASTPVAVTNLASGVAAIAVGEAHSCALMTSGGVQCWGANGNGQLGNGSTTDSSTPVAVTNLPSDVVGIYTGGYHTCVLTSAGGVQCWGANSNGQLGNGSTTDSRTPVAVTNLASGVADLAMGYRHTCALMTAGRLQCWGYNVYGQLGNGTTTSSSTPGAVTRLATGVVKVVAGKYQTCALLGLGVMQCWGWNVYGQLGNNSTANSPAPVVAKALPGGAMAVTMGSGHSCQLDTFGGVVCWGYNSSGQLGNGTTTSSLTPVAVPGLATAVAVATSNIVVNGSTYTQPTSTIVTGYVHTCGLTNAGGVRCWGQNNHGQLGNNSTSASLWPAPVTNLAVGVAAIAAGSESSHTCALTNTGGALCWGLNNSGQLGNGATADSPVPVAVTNLGSGVAAITPGNAHTCALTTGGGVQCWGSGVFGQLGNGTNTNSLTPVGVAGLGSGVVAITAGSRHECALTASGSVQCWGWNLLGQLGNGANADSYTPVTTTLSGPAGAIAAGSDHTCALLASGAVQCWGSNTFGELGSGSATPTPVSTAVGVISLAGSVASIASGGYHSCAVLTSGAMQCWGRNLNGQLGLGSTKDTSTPLAVTNLASGVVAAVGGDSATCALTSVGGVQCWGTGFNGAKAPYTVLAGVSLSLTAPSSLAAAAGTTLSIPVSNGSVATLDSWTPDTCTVTDQYRGGVTGLKPGLCGVRATRNGFIDTGTSWADAPQQLRLIPITSATPALTLATSNNPSAVGASVTFTVTLANAASPSGNVSFCADATTTNATCSGGTLLCTVPVSGSQAACSTNTLAAGTHTISAYFAGDANNSAATSGTLSEFIGNPPAFTSANAATFKVGQSGSFSVSASGTPTPTFTFSGGTLPNGTQFVDNGNGTASLSGTPAAGSMGTYTIQILAHNGVTPDATQAFTLTVQPAAPALTLATSSNPSASGANVTFTVTLANAVSPSGNVSLCADATTTNAACSGGTLLCTVPVSGSQAVCSTSTLASGTHAISAYFAGDANNGAATSGTLSELIGNAPAFTSANATTLKIGQSGSFSVSASGTPTPSFALASGTLPNGMRLVDNNNGTASLSGAPGAGSVGSYTVQILARNGITPDATQTFTLTVQQATSSVALVAAPASILQGQSTTLTATITTQNAAAGGTLSFTDGGTTLPGCGAVAVTASTLRATCTAANLALGSHSITATYSGDASTTGSNNSPSIMVTVQAPGTSIALNDTGQTLCDSGAAMNPVLVACTTAIFGDSDTYPRQDARFGRDAAAIAGALAKTGGGANGFDLTKICQNGTKNCAGNANASGYTGLAATDWTCTKDNITGLVWALYINNNELWSRAADSTSTTNDVALANANSLCGYNSGWRLPTRRELLSIVNYGAATGPLIDTNYFPGTGGFYFWSADTYLPPPQFIPNAGPSAWMVDFGLGHATFGDVRSGSRVRVVHGSP